MPFLRSPRRLAALAAALGLGLVVAGGPAAAQSLEEALALAYDGNPTLAAQRAELRATNEEVPQALAGYRPTVTAQGSAGAEWSDTETTLGAG